MVAPKIQKTFFFFTCFFSDEWQIRPTFFYDPDWLIRRWEFVWSWFHLNLSQGTAPFWWIKFFFCMVNWCIQGRAYFRTKKNGPARKISKNTFPPFFSFFCFLRLGNTYSTHIERPEMVHYGYSCFVLPTDLLPHMKILALGLSPRLANEMWPHRVGYRSRIFQ